MHCILIQYVVFILAVAVTGVQSGVDNTDNADTPAYNGEEIILPMCRNFLPYNWTKLPNQFGHATQVEVYRNIEHQWAYMDYGCSNNFRQFVCSLYLPKYDPVTQTVAGPCKEMCSKARNRCKKIKWETRCNALPSKRNDDACLRPVQESRVEPQHVNCVDNVIPMCKSLNSLGSLPNFFLQRSLEEITTEMRFYEDLVSTNCNANLRFFLCGTYMPICVPNISPFTIPCKEVCEEIHRDCSTHFESIYQGLPWPNKLQCHRYTPSNDKSRHCAMPDKFY